MMRCRCGDVVPGCATTFQGSHDEIVGAVANHLLREHGVIALQPQVLARIDEVMIAVA